MHGGGVNSHGRVGRSKECAEGESRGVGEVETVRPSLGRPRSMPRGRVDVWGRFKQAQGGNRDVAGERAGK